MVATDDQYELGGDPNPSRPVDLDFPTLGRLVEAEGSDLHESAARVNVELAHLTRAEDEAPAVATAGEEPEDPCSPEEVIARLNGIGAAAYRLARHVRTLVEFRAIHLARTEDRGDR
jgi:hypothetical protein